jgi:hypothetical protein
MCVCVCVCVYMCVCVCVCVCMWVQERQKNGCVCICVCVWVYVNLKWKWQICAHVCVCVCTCVCVWVCVLGFVWLLFSVITVKCFCLLCCFMMLFCCFVIWQRLLLQLATELCSNFCRLNLSVKFFDCDTVLFKSFTADDCYSGSPVLTNLCWQATIGYAKLNVASSFCIQFNSNLREASTETFLVC